MGKQGPCCHCGVTSTPLWRNGPPAKPVLCNACGSRWRTKGNLVNYIPGQTCEERKPRRKKLRAHAISPHVRCKGSLEDKTTEQKNDALAAGSDDETCGGSSPGSGMSDSGKCVQLGSMDRMDASGCIPSPIHKISIPRRKRTARIYYTPTPVEHLQKSLCEVMKNQELSNLTDSAEDVLIYDCQTPLSWPEVGLGTILIKPPTSSAEEESVGSSLILENRILGVKSSHVAAPILSAHSQSGKSTYLRVQDGSTPHQWTPSKLSRNFFSSIHNNDARWSNHLSDRKAQTELSSENLKPEKDISSKSPLQSQILLPTNVQLGPPGFEEYQVKESSGCFSPAVGVRNLTATVRPFAPSLHSPVVDKETSLRSCCTLRAETLLPSKRSLERPNSEASSGKHGCWTAQHHRWTNRRPPMNPSSFKDPQSGRIPGVPSSYVHSSQSYAKARYATVFPAERVKRDVAGGATSNRGVISSVPEGPLSIPIRKEETKAGEKTRGAVSCTPTVCSPGKDYSS